MDSLDSLNLTAPFSEQKKSFKQLIMGTKQSNNVQLPVVAEKVEEATSDDVKDIEQEMVSHLQ